MPNSDKFTLEAADIVITPAGPTPAEAQPPPQAQRTGRPAAVVAAAVRSRRTVR